MRLGGVVSEARGLNMKSEWINSKEASELIECSIKSLAGYLRKGKNKSSVRRKPSGNSDNRVLYNRADIEALIEYKRVHAEAERQDVPVIDGSMWHPAMCKPWNYEGLRGIFN